jgi:hypothetical protein
MKQSQANRETRMPRFIPGGLLAAAVLLLSITPVRAQESASIQALATVVSSITIRGINNLNFQTVTPGIPKSVDKATVGFAGEWQVTGIASSQVTLTFDLPSELTDAISGEAMSIAFSSSDASYDDGSGGGQTAPVGVVNPNGPSTANIGSGGTLDVWIGGTVQPAVSQTGGSYGADITLTVAYTGS